MKQTLTFICVVLGASLFLGGAYWFLGRLPSDNFWSIHYEEDEFIGNEELYSDLSVEEWQVQAADLIRADVDDIIQTGELMRKEKKTFPYTSPYEPVSKTIYYYTEYHVVLKYMTETGSDDSAIKSEFYYDADGVLVYALFTGGAVNGSVLKHQIYFDEYGDRISELHEYTAGPGYTFPEVWPENEIVYDPESEFENDTNMQINNINQNTFWKAVSTLSTSFPDSGLVQLSEIFGFTTFELSDTNNFFSTFKSAGSGSISKAELRINKENSKKKLLIIEFNPTFIVYMDKIKQKYPDHTFQFNQPENPIPYALTITESWGEINFGFGDDDLLKVISFDSI